MAKRENKKRGAVGHNSLDGEQLVTIVERIERLQEEKQGIQGDISDIFAEAKGNGFDCPTIRRQLKRRKLDQAKRDEQDMLDETYRHALGEIFG